MSFEIMMGFTDRELFRKQDAKCLLLNGMKQSKYHTKTNYYPHQNLLKLDDLYANHSYHSKLLKSQFPNPAPPMPKFA